MPSRSKAARWQGQASCWLFGTQETMQPRWEQTVERAWNFPPEATTMQGSRPNRKSLLPFPSISETEPTSISSTPSPRSGGGAA